MTSNAEMLNYIHQNSQMGVDTIRQLVEIVKDEDLNAELNKQLNEYQDIYDKTEELMNNSQEETKGISTVSKIMTYISISMKTLNDKTPSYIAQMLIQGSTMGVIDITKNIKKYSDIKPEIMDLANKLLKFEQANIEKLKAYL